MPVIPATILKVVGIELTSIGRIEAQPGEEAIVLEDAAGGHYRKLVIAEGKIAGAILLGHGNDAAAVRTAITRGFDVSHAPGHAARGPLGDPGAAQRRPAARPRRRCVAE